MLNSDTTSVLETLLKNQSNNYSFILNVLTAGIALFLGTQWLWNLYYRKGVIREDVGKAIENTKMDLEKKLNDQIKQSSARIEQELITKQLKLSADLSRSYGITQANIGMHFRASEWWLAALDEYITLDHGRLINVCADAVLVELNDSSWMDQNKLGSDRFNFDDAFRIADRIPDTLYNTRNKLKEKLSELKKIYEQN